MDHDSGAYVQLRTTMKKLKQPHSLSLVTTLVMSCLIGAGLFGMVDSRAQEPIKIGLVTPLSGVGGSYGPNIVKAAEAAAARINQAGGILQGRKLQIITEDSATDAVTAMRAARKLIENDRVVAIAGMWGSGPTLAVKAVALEQGVVVMTQGAADAITDNNDNSLIWQFQVAGNEWSIPVAKAMLAANHRRVAVLSLQNPFTASMLEPFIDTIEAAGGEVLASAGFSPEQDGAALQSVLDEVLGPQPDAIFIPAFSAAFGKIFQQARDKGYAGAVYTFSIAASAGARGDGRIIGAIGAQAAEGIHHLRPALALDRPEYQTFAQTLENVDGELNPFAVVTVDQINILALAMEQAGSTEAKLFAKRISAISNEPGSKTGDVLQALQLIRSGEDIDYTGIGMDIAFKADGSLQSRPFAHLQIKDGKDIGIELLE
jgi:branched-chain amino acid transport system substrate-binding protein